MPYLMNFKAKKWKMSFRAEMTHLFHIPRLHLSMLGHKLQMKRLFMVLVRLWSALCHNTVSSAKLSGICLWIGLVQYSSESDLP